jgi:hypothetical protein
MRAEIDAQFSCAQKRAARLGPYKEAGHGQYVWF